MWKSTAILYCCILWIIFQFISYSGYSQAGPSNDQQIIENGIMIRELSKDVEEQKEKSEKNELKRSSELDKKIAVLEENLQLQKENLSFRSNVVDRWLSVLGIVLTVFGIGIPVIGFIYGKKLMDDLTRQTEKANKVISQFIRDSKDRIRLLEKEAANYIDNIKKHEQRSIESSEKIEDLSRKAARPHLSDEEKTDLSIQAKEIKKDEQSSPYDKDMAHALDLYLSGKYNQAIIGLKSILKFYPEQITIEKLCQIYFYLGYAYGAMKKMEESRSYYKKILELNAEHPEAWNNLGVTYFESAKYDKAIPCFKKAVEFKSTYAGAWHNLGSSFSKKEKYDDAIESYQKAIVLDPEHPKFLTNLALAYTKNTLFEKAVETFKKALEKDPKSELSYTNLAEVLIFTNQLEEAGKLLLQLQEVPERNLFTVGFLEALLGIIRNDSTESIKKTNDELKKIVEDGEEMTWSFEEINTWLSSDASSYLTSEQRSTITELVHVLEEWKKELKAPRLKDQQTPD